MRRYLAKALALFLVAFSASALAMGLGDIRLNSYLNQRLDAEIELVSAAADEIETLEVTLADRDAFERIGLERPAVLGSLDFKVVRRPNGTAYIQVTSDEPIREPFLTFLVEADWSRGRLLREYTLLLDPPTFAEESEPAEASSPAPAVTPTPARPEPRPEPREQAEVSTTGEPEPLQPEPMEPAPAEAPEEQVTEEPVAEEQVAEEPAAEKPAEEAVEPEAEAVAEEESVSIPPLEADREERREPVYRQAPDVGDSYGPIQRNETLWSIASRMRPDDSVTMNQMMVAIYRANPEAFAGNMNRMKQGYILRIPDFSEVSRLTRSEAFRAAKQMNDEWDASRGRAATADFRTEPEVDDSLSLVAPEEDVEPEVGTGVGAGGEADDLGAPGDAAVELGEDDVDEGAVDLVEEESETADRLIDIEDESMQAMQEGAGEEAAATAETGVEADEGPAADETMAEDTLDDLPPLPAETEVTADAGEEATADASEPVTADDTDTAVETEPETEADSGAIAESGEPEEAAAAEETTQQQPERSAVVTTRQPEPKSLVDQVLEFMLSTIGLVIIGGVLVLILGMIALIQRRRSAAKEQAASEMADWLADEEADSEETVVAGGDDEDATVVAGGGEEPTEGGDDFGGMFGTDEEHEGSGTETLSDDAADSTQMISPEDRPEPAPEEGSSEESVGGETVTLDENDPLSEADFNMAYGLYDQAAEVVQKASDREPGRTDLLAKLCEIHFAANNKDEFMDAARKLKDAAGGDGEEWNNVAIMGQQIAPNDDLFAGGGASSGGVDLDFGSEDDAGGDETDFEATMTGTPAGEDTAASEAPSAGKEDAGDDLDFDLDIGDLGGGDESPAAEEKPAEEASGEADTGGDLDFDLDFDTGGDETPAADESKPAESPAESDESTSDSDDFDLGDMDLGDLGGDEEETDFAAAASEGESAKSGGDQDYDSDNTQTEFDKALNELSAYVDTNLPEGGAGDEVATEEKDSGGDDLNLDDFNFDKESESMGSDDELGGGDEDDDEGLGEIGTKLDLARAYVDMGDPDGARSILEEVLEDGDEQQKQEAQELLDKL